MNKDTRIEVFHKRFYYDAETGKLFYKNPDKKEAGWFSGYGYLTVTVAGQREMVHRIIWEMHYGPIKHGLCVDHIDRNTLNNRLSNLRVVTPAENSRNRNTSNKITGVYWDKAREAWVSYIKVGFVAKNLGRTSDFFEACCLRKSAEVKYGFYRQH